MKINNKYISMMAIAAFGLAMTACGDKNGDEPNPDGGNTDGKEIVIQADVYTRADKKLQLTTGDDMIVFVKSAGSIQAADFQKPVKATLNGTTWSTDPKIRIKEGQTLFFYAVSPYNAAYTNPTEIPVNTKDQIDLLYSGEFAPASFQTNTIKFSMKHALALCSFNIMYQGNGTGGDLTSLSVHGETVHTTGTMNVETGKIKAQTNEQVTVQTKKTVSATGWKEDLPGVWIIPFDNAGEKAQLTAVIGGKTFTLAMPAINMKPGYQYIFHLIMTPNGLTLDTSATDEISLNVGNDAMAEMVGFGTLKFGFSGSEFIHPIFDGNQVFGNVASGTTYATFAPGAKTAIPGSGTREVIVETWNSHGFEVTSLENIESIDISGY